EAPPAGERASHCVFAIVLDEGLDRHAFRQRLARRGVQTSVHFPALHSGPSHDRQGKPLPLTEAFAERAVSLPLFPNMEDWQRELVIEATVDAAAVGCGELAVGKPARSRSAVAG
ncbi:MAG TPA: DegT/DnrJ/EryC1/StrS family aminotransferase, partial [Actinomycetota bacterium]